MHALRLVSLRARLLAGLVVLAAIGLLVAGFATYRAERSFLYNRAKQQLLSSISQIEDEVALSDRLAYHVGRSTRGQAAGGQPAGADADDDGGGGGGGGGPSSVPAAQVHPQPPGENLGPPPGTFGEHLSAAGTRIGKPFAYNVHSEYAPAIPEHFRSYVSRNLARPSIYRTSATGDPSLQYLYVIKPADVGYGYTVVAVSLGDVDASLGRLQKIEAIVIGSVLLALAVLAWFVIRLGLRPLDRIGATARAIAAGDLSRRVSPADSRTEVGRLGLALNAMLGQIEQAFGKQRESEERLRRFLSDASHELRTPLTSIRGYAELFRLGAAATPAETAKAMQRIEQEASRMGVLVDELLALARLDEMPQATREPIDIGPLVHDAGYDAKAVAPDREIDVAVEPEGGHIVSGDVHQLRQVLANLLTNAVKHTPAGTPIEVSLARENGLERIEVRDHGPGLPHDAHDAVFERFWRAEAGRERGKAGAGLGLSIVAEIVEAHDGRVSAGNAPDGGAVFVIELPAAKRAG
jgi:two-component system OmpR family sensor kinase